MTNDIIETLEEDKKEYVRRVHLFKIVLSHLQEKVNIVIEREKELGRKLCQEELEAIFGHLPPDEES